MSCVAARPHEVCLNDCPECDDPRAAVEEPWDAPVPVGRSQVYAAYPVKHEQWRRPEVTARRRDALATIRNGRHARRRATRLVG